MKLKNIHFSFELDRHHLYINIYHYNPFKTPVDYTIFFSLSTGIFIPFDPLYSPKQFYFSLSALNFHYKDGSLLKGISFSFPIKERLSYKKYSRLVP